MKRVRLNKDRPDPHSILINAQATAAEIGLEVCYDGGHGRSLSSLSIIPFHVIMIVRGDDNPRYHRLGSRGDSHHLCRLASRLDSATIAQCSHVQAFAEDGVHCLRCKR
jgi:hypothetical protein